MLGKIDGGRRRGWQRIRWWMASPVPTQWVWDWVNSRNWWWTGRLGVLQSMGSQRSGLDCVTELNSLRCFPYGSVGKESSCNVWVLGSIPGLERSPGEGKGYPLQYAGLENSLDCIVRRVTKSQTRRSNFHFTSLSIIWLNEIISNNRFNIL